MFEQLAKLLKVLNSESSPVQVSLAFVAGMVLGLTPLWSLHNLVLLFLIMVIAVNLSGVLVSWALFSGIAYLFDPFMERVGEALLTLPALQGLWITLYNSDVARLFHFNNTLTLGSLVVALVLAVPLYFFTNFLIARYRNHLLAWVRKSKLIQMLKAGKFYKAYEQLSQGGAL